MALIATRVVRQIEHTPVRENRPALVPTTLPAAANSRRGGSPGDNLVVSRTSAALFAIAISFLFGTLVCSR